MGDRFKCVHCSESQKRNLRLKNGVQRYCGKPQCQRARKADWQRSRLASDPALRDEQRMSQRVWLDKTPEYWREYRQKNPKKAERNRLLQRLRRQRASFKQRTKGRATHQRVAKMDALGEKKHKLIQHDGEYWFIPRVAKMDAFLARIAVISNRYDGVAKMDALDTSSSSV